MAKLVEVYMFESGNVMAFDETGEQVMECQGFILDIASKLIENSDSKTKFSYVHWHDGIKVDCDFGWWFEKYRESKDKRDDS